MFKQWSPPSYILFFASLRFNRPRTQKVSLLAHHYTYALRAQFASARFGSITRRRFCHNPAPKRHTEEAGEPPRVSRRRTHCTSSISIAITSHYSGTPIAIAHSSMRPFATRRVAASHGQPFACVHCNTSRCPPQAAPAHVVAFHGQPYSPAHFSNSRCPFSAAHLHVH